MDILVVCPDSYDRWAFERVEGHRFHFVDAGISHWDASPEFDPVAYLDRCRTVMAERHIGAVVSTHDLGRADQGVVCPQRRGGVSRRSPDADGAPEAALRFFRVGRRGRASRLATPRGSSRPRAVFPHRAGRRA